MTHENCRQQWPLGQRAGGQRGGVAHRQSEDNVSVVDGRPESGFRGSTLTAPDTAAVANPGLPVVILA